jgi:hypothetical protein
LRLRSFWPVDEGHGEAVGTRSGDTRYVISPLSHQNDGGPGGVIFDQKLSEEGRYEIRVGQYEKESDKFELFVDRA